MPRDPIGIKTNLGAAIGDATHELLVEIQRQSHALVLESAIRHTPVGDAQDKHAGLMRRSWQSIGESAIERLGPSKVRNISPHALIVDRGRRRSE